MGYKPGTGLGKESEGIIEPIEESAHKGKHGLGLTVFGLEKRKLTWEPETVHHIKSVLFYICTKCFIVPLCKN